jgi:hypothetical protein
MGKESKKPAGVLRTKSQAVDEIEEEDRPNHCTIFRHIQIVIPRKTELPKGKYIRIILNLPRTIS